jgi:hypothetical protein
MAQAFEIPTGNRMATGPTLTSSRTHAFQIASSGRPDLTNWTLELKYGSPFGSPQARICRQSAARGGPDSLKRIINPVGFDKITALDDGPGRRVPLDGRAAQRIGDPLGATAKRNAGHAIGVANSGNKKARLLRPGF